MPSPAPRFRLSSSIASVCLLLLAGTAPLAAQAPFLVKDINPSGASAPTELVTMGGVTFFAADDGSAGIELWKSDGTSSGTTRVKDICPGACSSTPHRLTVATVSEGERVFFAAQNGTDGWELWKSDGTAGGTAMVKDIFPGASSPALTQLTAVGDVLFFKASDGVYGAELWKSDGTGAGTEMVKDIATGIASSTPNSLADLGGTLFFSALGSQGRELWKSDGTEAGTVLVKDINPGGASSGPGGLCAVGNTLFFVAYTGYGTELWKSDGTPGGTSQVRNINPGFASSYPSHLTAVGSDLYFVADDGTTGAELWKSDGTYAGTVQVKDIAPGAVSSAASGLTAVGSLLFFAAEDGLGRELWRSDGTGTGTYLVEDINTGSPDSSPGELQNAGGMLYFVADDGIAGQELWVSDGTASGTNRVDDLLAGPAGSSPTEPTPTPSALLFAADDAQQGRELWALQSGAPVLQLTKLFNDSEVEVGTSGHTFDLTVSNTGSAPASAVRITDLVDDRLTVDDVSPSLECDDSNDQYVDCTFPTLAEGTFQKVTVTYSIAGGVTPADDVLNVAYAGDLEGQLVEASDTVDIVAPCTLDPHVDVVDEVIYSSYLAEACISVSVGPSVTLMTGADATFSAGHVVILNDGFAMEAGSELTVIAD